MENLDAIGKYWDDVSPLHAKDYSFRLLNSFLIQFPNFGFSFCYAIQLTCDQTRQILSLNGIKITVIVASISTKS